MKALTPIALLCLVSASAFSQPIQYLVYDGNTYTSDQLKRASTSPYAKTQPKAIGNDYSVPRAADGHYYIPGNVNGFPIIFMVDTGAAFTTLPSSMAKNAGFRTGLVKVFEGVSGRVRGGQTEGNALTIGSFTFSGVQISVLEDLKTPLLGADILNRFQITYANASMLIRVSK